MWKKFTKLFSLLLALCLILGLTPVAANQFDENAAFTAAADSTFDIPVRSSTSSHPTWNNTNTPGLTTAMLRGATRIEVAVSAQISGGINMYFGPGGSINYNHYPAFTWNASARIYWLDLTQQNMAAFTGNNWAFMIGHTGWSTPFNNLGVTSITLYYGAEVVRTITVGEQTGALRAGIPGMVTFPVATQNIDNGSYTVAVANTPVGVSVGGQLQITNNSGILTLAGNRYTLAGVRDTLILTIGNTNSAPFSLKIDPGPHYGDVNSNNVIDADDLARLRQYIAAADQEAFLHFNRENADVNGDGVINAADSTLLRRYLADPTVPLGPPSPEPKYLIALTFDDGPNTGVNNGTVGVLNALERHGVVATFFINGRHISTQTRPILQRMLDAGHTIENHTWSHPYFTTGGPGGGPMTWDAMLEQIESTSAALYDAVGVWPSFFRPPYFAVGNHCIGLDIATGLPFVFCGIDTNDWDSANDAQAIANAILNAARNGVQGFSRPAVDNNGADGAIVLQHDGPTSNQVVRTIAAMDIFIPQLKEMGYGFVTVSELFKIRNATPEVFTGGWTNRWVRPTAGSIPDPDPGEEIVISLRPEPSSPDVYKPGDTFAMQIYIENPDEKSIGSISYLDIMFDPDVLELDSDAPFTPGGISTAERLSLIAPDSVGDSKARFSFDSEKDFTDEGVLLTLHFKVKGSPQAGSSDVTLALAGMSPFIGAAMDEGVDYVLVSSAVTIEEDVPITSIRINGLSIETMERGQIRPFHVTLNTGANDERIIWSIADPSLGYVDEKGNVTLFDKTGNVRLTATDPIGGLSHSITLRIAS